MGTQHSLPKKGAEPPSPQICGPRLLWPNGWMDQDATWYGGRARPKRHCVTWEPSSPSPKGSRAPNFRPMAIVAKRSPISATAEHLFSDRGMYVNTLLFPTNSITLLHIPTFISFKQFKWLVGTDGCVYLFLQKSVHVARNVCTVYRPEEQRMQAIALNESSQWIP